MQLKSSLISFNHHFDSPVIPTEARIKVLKISTLIFLIPKFAQHLHNIYFIWLLYSLVYVRFL